MLCAPADETSVSAPVAVTRSYTVVALLVAVSWLVVFVVSKDVLNVVVVSRLVVALVPTAVLNVVVVDLLVLKEVVLLVA
jgi:hypothetical protein